MKLYWFPRTRAARAVWMLEELGTDYERIEVDLRATERDPDFLEASPLGKVPAIADGKVRLADSAAICTYLADRYALGRLSPELEHPERAQYLYWMFFAAGTMEPAMAEKFGGWTTNRHSHGWGDFDLMVGALEKHLADRQWILGDWFTAADVMVGSTVHFMEVFGILPESQPIRGYLGRCREREAFGIAQQADAEAH